MASNIFDAAHAALMVADPTAKISAVNRLVQVAASLSTDPSIAQLVVPVPIPGRPVKPDLVAPRELAHRGLGTLVGRVALIHAVAHIEFNAINLALDAVYRFRDLPPDYYVDWLTVAAEEARHFSLLQQRLLQLGSGYGELPAHNGLWEAACATADSCLTRMALVPRVLEARGLDVTPGMIERLTRVGDHETVAILEVILEEEVGHVATGTHWFHYCCERAGVEPEATFLDLVQRHSAASVRPPFNLGARQRAGFGPVEQAGIESIAAAGAAGRGS